jgi:hypothetical protein
MDSLNRFSPDVTAGQALCGFCDGKRQCYFYPTIAAESPAWVNCPTCEGRGWLPPTLPRDAVQRTLVAIRIDALAIRQREVHAPDSIEMPPDTPFEEWADGVDALLREVQRGRHDE